MGWVGHACLVAALIIGTVSPSVAGDQASDGKKLFTMQCSTCHAVQPGTNGVGPSLAGVYGRSAGTLPGFNYSPALKNSGLTWNDDTLDAWLSNPLKDVPGTHMFFPGLADAAQREAVIAYLKTL